jgi:cation diffusion facilitator CzcD-associated flavoprotein CzcO
MVEVAVIGAGAAGLVASRHLLGSGLRPYIFDTAKTVGGERRFIN